jgi:hypothetical protein
MGKSGNEVSGSDRISKRRKESDGITRGNGLPRAAKQ